MNDTVKGVIAIFQEQIIELRKKIATAEEAIEVLTKIYDTPAIDNPPMGDRQVCE